MAVVDNFHRPSRPYHFQTVGRFLCQIYVALVGLCIPLVLKISPRHTQTTFLNIFRTNHFIVHWFVS